VCGHIDTVSGAPATVAIYCHRIRVTTADGTHLSRLQFDDVNPFSAVGATLRSPAILLVTTFSALLFALTFSLSFTVSLKFSAQPYGYNALGVGLVLLSFGVGNMLGSVAGGRWSDLVQARLTRANDGRREPEMRLKSTLVALPIIVAATASYGWTVQEEAPIAACIAVLVVLGASLLFSYSSLLAYLVDASPGRASSAIGINSLLRGPSAAAAVEISRPVLKAFNSGPLYTAWAIMMAASSCGIVLVSKHGRRWREGPMASR